MATPYADPSLSIRQIEARTTGEQNETVKFLNAHPLLAYITFTLAIVSAVIWAEMMITLAYKAFGVKREDMTVLKWLIFAATFTILSYLIIRFVIKVPLTAAFSL